MTLYTERPSVHLTVATDCIISFNARSNNKDEDSGKRRATELHVSATQKFLLEFTRLHDVWTKASVMAKLHVTDRYKHA